MKGELASAVSTLRHMAYHKLSWTAFQVFMCPRSTNNYVPVIPLGAHMEQSCQLVLAMSAVFSLHQSRWNHTNVSDIQDWVKGVPRFETDVMQHTSGGDDCRHKDLVALAFNMQIQWETNKLCFHSFL